MGIKDKYRVLPIERSDYKEWLLHKHYAHRLPSISHSFGLYDDNILQGVCTYGMPPLTSVSFICDGIKMIDILELNRLCVNDGLERNVLSFFVSKTLKLLPQNIIILSYADINNGHHGYIYQSTNWIYTGLGSVGSKSFHFNNKEIHSRHINKDEFFINRKLPYDDNLTIEENFKKIGGDVTKLKPKHRYIMINGDKRYKKNIMKKFKLEILPYPKGDNKRYDASYQPDIQPILF